MKIFTLLLQVSKAIPVCNMVLENWGMQLQLFLQLIPKQWQVSNLLLKKPNQGVFVLEDQI